MAEQIRQQQESMRLQQEQMQRMFTALNLNGGGGHPPYRPPSDFQGAFIQSSAGVSVQIRGSVVSTVPTG